METTAVTGSEAVAAEPKAAASPTKHAAKNPAVDKYAEARHARKKAKRATHRRTIKRSNTNG